MTERSELESYLQEFNIESIFTEELMPHLSIVHFPRGGLICSQGDVSEYLYILVKGKVKIYTTSKEGKTYILSFKEPIEVIGDIEYVQNIDFINTVEAVTLVTMIRIHHTKLRKYVGDHGPFLKFLLEVVTKKFAIKDENNYNFMYPVDVRLASYLLSMNLEESQHSPLQINVKEVSNLIGTSSRHLNRVIQQFCEKGLMERQKDTVFIKDIDELRKLAGHY